MPKTNIHIGTSGWHYNHWKGPFYPEDVSNFLQYYMKFFYSVEINNTFYRLPDKKVFSQWHQSAAKNFIFSVKASRYITHMKKLKNSKDALKVFLQRVDALRENLGPILFQLPPHWTINLERLKEFLTILPKRYRYAFEFRDTSWFDNQTFTLLKEFNAAFCIYDFNKILSPKKTTANFVYIRLHGPGGPYVGDYSSKVLLSWARDILKWAQAKLEVFCYFDNDQAGYAVKNALQIQKMVQDL